jgi:hypothetical protein
VRCVVVAGDDAGRVRCWDYSPVLRALRLLGAGPDDDLTLAATLVQPKVLPQVHARSFGRPVWVRSRMKGAVHTHVCVCLCAFPELDSLRVSSDHLFFFGDCMKSDETSTLSLSLSVL